MQPKLVLGIVICLVPLSLHAQQRRTPNTTPAGDALPGLTASQRTAFTNGRADFTEVETVNDGLGPVYNGRSCTECHNDAAVGGGSPRTVTRFGTVTNGIFDPLTQFGGSLIQVRGINAADGSPHNFLPERVPPAATIVTRRRTTPLFGLGLVDATPDSTFVALASAEAARGDGTAGRINSVQNISAGMNTVGKFGWKAQVPTLHQFAGDAYLNEMGITNPQFPNENCPSGNCAELAFNPRPGLNDSGEGVDALTDFMTLLAPPPRANVTPDATAGEALFDRIGCTSCHVATLQSGTNPVAALDRKAYHPYSDFLLHDMGALGDGIVQGNAAAREIRTQPLWGLRFVTRYLHDGRAGSPDQAIAAHDGQARAARDRYLGLDAASKQKVLAFLQSL